MAEQNTNSSFWASPEAEPKRSYKYLAVWGDKSIPWFVISSVDLPKAETGEAKTYALNHTFKWPGRITWNDISMEITDSEKLDCAKVLVDKLIKSGYSYPENPTIYRTISKQGAIAAFGGSLTIYEITWDEKIIGAWKLKNAWVKSFELGKKAYESDDPQKISLNITYDWAFYDVSEKGNPVSG